MSKEKTTSGIYTNYGDDCFELSPEFKGNLIDAVEDFLETKGVNIENPEKTDSDNPAIIYGSDYDLLAGALQEAITSWLPPVPNGSEAEQIVKTLPPMLIYAAYAYQRNEYLKEDAKIRSEDMGYSDFFDESDYEELARRFLLKQDCGLDENSVWEALIEDYLILKESDEYEK